jgi:NAD(P)-dependent dehydrogenase (short-subunit alcohol dehydrogenase family)
MTALFDLTGRVAVVTGGSGAIGSATAAGLATAGARVVTLARDAGRAGRAAAQIRGADGDATAIAGDVRSEQSLATARDEILARYGSIDVLVNCAGGNVPAATLADQSSPFAVPYDAFRDVVDLNLGGTVLATQVFGSAMRHSAGCSIVNVSSMAASRALTRVGGYGAAKAAVESLTRWWAVELARRGTGIRVNAIAPGFVIGEQNRRLLLEEDGTPTARGAAILARTPLTRFAEPADLVSTVVWLASDGARFVTGAVVPVDGGFAAFSGV